MTLLPIARLVHCFTSSGADATVLSQRIQALDDNHRAVDIETHGISFTPYMLRGLTTWQMATPVEVSHASPRESHKIESNKIL